MYKLPNEERGSHGQEVNDNDSVRVDSPVKVVHGVDEDIGEEVNFEHDGEEVYEKAHEGEEVQKVDAASFKWASLHGWTDVYAMN